MKRKKKKRQKKRKNQIDEEEEKKLDRGRRGKDREKVGEGKMNKHA